VDKIAYGTHEVGDFTISLAPTHGREEKTADDCDFFEVLVLERKFGTSFYVDIGADQRFDWFGHLGKFDRRLTHDDLVEYNARCSMVFHKIAMPTWKLGRYSIKPRLVDLCKAASKKSKKK
jgi:hypothetical protein